ncbi:MAG: lptD 2 [Firmicutes bacterium]|nr:lptD 2 [Bacillota bacterium]
MKRWEKGFWSILTIVLGITMYVSASEAAAPEKNKAETAQLPIVIEAENMHFNDATGALFADGNVIITQGTSKITANRVDGNTKQSEIWIDGQAHMLQPNVNLVGDNARYNYQQRTGTMQKASGTIDKQIITADTIEMLPKETIIHNGTVTRCPAKVPDYHVSATKVEIWPGEKMILYNAKFWIKNTVIFSLPKYQKGLEESSQSEFPSIGYNNRDGISIRQHVEYPLSDRVTLFADPAYYGNQGFKPKYGMIDREKEYSLQLQNGYFRDSNHNWIKKEEEFAFHLKPQKIGSTSLSYTLNALSGFWDGKTYTGNQVRSWHQEYLLYILHEPININSNTTLSMGTGWETVMDSYNHSTQSALKMDITLGKIWNSKLFSYIGYHHFGNTETVFAYNKPDIPQEIDIGFVYKIDRLNSVGVSQRYDIENHRVYDLDFTWYRNLHCWDMIIMYREKRKEIDVDLVTVKW